MARKVMDQVEQVTAANSRTNNVISGRRYDRAPFSGYLTIFSTGSAAGLECDVNVGGRAATGGQVPLNTQNRFPVIPDDLLVDGIEVYAGELIQIQQINTTAGALSGRYKIELTEAEEYYS